MTGSEAIPAGLWVVIIFVILGSGIYGVLLLFHTDEVLRWMARMQIRMSGLIGGTLEDLPPKRREYMRKLLESPEETGGPNRCILRFAGCGSIFFCIVLIIFSILAIVSM